MKKINIKDLEGLSKEDVLGMVEIKKQVSIVQKIAAAESIVDELVDLDDSGLYTYDEVTKMISEAMAKVQLYTNVELTDDVYSDYDIINGIKLDELIDDYSDSELLEYIIDLKFNQIINQNTINHVVSRSMSHMVDIIDKTMDHVNLMLDKGDPNKIAKYLSKGIEMLANKMPDFSTLDVTKTLGEQLDRKKMN